MATYTTRVKLTSDRRITVEVPEDMPLGDAEVTVKVGEAGEASGPQISGTGEQLLAWMEEERRLHPRTWTPRTKEEVDRDILALREEWDR